ncbi:competence type IV pilus minor pilin ComGD [Staphylococcus lutrae]|uniref:Competence protein ComGD n=1 Tax=Staphylococcus lutrae TaxID=155085 RepID=A0AAC9WL49_9STAP|nr:competence type IV pilus minor pilin ComGD [Staphylococcus lutrae]ARJ49847.1 competence protein ComGD [Staphylococcus lutrae]PNZ37790.1 prepilin-type N-terminal cleavage/methylation domain-containing protein [Staphylococcus lutrae]
MEKPLRRDGFTLIEMLVVLSIVSLFIFLTITHPQFNILLNDSQYQINKLTSEIDFYQSQAIKHQQSVLIVFRKTHNDLKIETTNPHRTTFISLEPLKLRSDSNLDAILFDKEGKITKFGTVKFDYRQQHISLIFHIEQGRYRVSYSK